MIANLKELVFFVFRNYLGGQVVSGVRRRGLLMYFRVVNGARRVLVTLAFLAICLHLMTLGFVGTVVTACWIWIKDENVRLNVLFGCCAVMFLVPLICGWFLLSERFWLRASSAGRLIDER